jgi:hypothetical protein
MMGEVNDNATAEKHKQNQINIIINKKKRYLEVISRSTRFKEFNSEKKKHQQKHRISLKSFRES